jgi:hypothetical protein
MMGAGLRQSLLDHRVVVTMYSDVPVPVVGRTLDNLVFLDTLVFIESPHSHTICLFISPDLDGHRAPKNKTVLRQSAATGWI